MSHTLEISPAEERRFADLVSQALETAARAGADECEAAVSHDLGLSVTARMRDIETLEYQNDRSFGVTVYFDRRKGSASTSDFRAEAITEAVERACSIARRTAEDPCAGLADPARLAVDPPDLALDHPWEISPEAAREMAIRCEGAALDSDRRISNSEGATVATSRGVRAYGNSHGFFGAYRRSSHSISCAVLAGDDGGMERDYHYTAARDPAALEALEAVGAKAAERTLRRLGARQVTTAKVPVLFPPELARGFIGHAVGAVSGTAQYRRSSFLLDAAGETLFPDFLNILERPHIPGAFGSAPFDREGVATADRDLVSAGVLQGYVLSTYSARRLGLETTGNAGGVHNLLVEGNADGLQALTRQMGRGLIVSELMGQGVNAVTGDYSRGAAGFWVEGGEIAYPVSEITIAGNLRELYRNIVAVGRDQDLRGVIRCGSVLVAEMTVAGN
ncbi:metalloprotease PmbA [Lentisalinibacter orientalis]|uniref:metalloprotease PmbA n=1 Tax=Lentisalinibacter orientalis TaxID=2992241 RepID=UPI003870EA2C